MTHWLCLLDLVKSLGRKAPSSKLNPKRDPQSVKNRIKKGSIFHCLLRSDVCKILVDFANKKEASWLLKSNPKRCYLQRRFYEKHRFSLRKAIILKVREVDVGSKNLSKLDPKLMLTCEGILASISHRFRRRLQDRGSLHRRSHLNRDTSLHELG